jgi:DNA-binding GntR family transcriptional regulator
MAPLGIEEEFSPQYSALLVEQITDFLTNAIIEGRIKGGQHLVENELQRSFRVSRAPIREAFRILEKNGLVVNLPRKGTFVRKITQKDIEESFPVRASLESLAAYLAISHLKTEDIKHMESALSQMTVDAKNNDFLSYLKHHFEFHEIFIKSSNNAVLISLLENLRRHYIWFRVSYLYLQESYGYSLGAHEKILELFKNKDADQVATLVKEHILIGLQRFVQLLRENKLSE